jgi:uncharacterized protein (DUF1330 family)
LSAYIIFQNRVHDPEALGAYIQQAVASMQPYGCEVIAMAEDSTVLEGSTDYPRTIVLKFESREKAQAWYDCPEYQAALPIRLGATEGFGLLIDGL